MMPCHEPQNWQDQGTVRSELRSGWTIIGETCLGLVLTSDTITANKTSILANGRESQLEPCEYGFKVRDTLEQDLRSQIFQRTIQDDTRGIYLKKIENFFQLRKMSLQR